MRTFYKKLSVFIILLIIICIGLDYLSMNNSWRTTFAKMTNSEELISAGTGEIIPYIEKVQQQDDTTILIIGDSVCHQMFQGLQQYNEDICMAGSNAAISMTGQYILAEEYIRNHPDATDIFLFVLPASLCITFDTTWGYQYTVMPFVETDTLKMLDQDTIHNMESVYGSFFMKPQVVRMIDESAVNRKLYLNMLKNYRTSYTQKSTFEIADRYIRKIYELCKENDVEFHLYPGPVSESKYQYTEELKNDYDSTWMKTCFPEYFDRLLVYSDEQSKDGVHFFGEYESQEYYNEKISVIFTDSELLDELAMDGK